MIKEAGVGPFFKKTTGMLDFLMVKRKSISMY